MSQWDDRIRSHRVWGVMSTIGPSIDKSLERPELPPEVIDSLERLRTVLSFCGKRLASADSSLVLPASVEGIAVYLTNLKSRVDMFALSGDVGHLLAANGDADSVLAQLATVLAVSTSDEFSALSEAAAAYRAGLERNLHSAIELQKKLAEHAQANDQRLENIETTLTAEQQRLANLINEFQTQFSTAQDKRGSEFTAAQNDQLTKFSSAFAELQTQFSSVQNNRDAVFAEFLRTSNDKISAFVSDAAAQLGAHNQHYQETLVGTAKDYDLKLSLLQMGYSEKATEILAGVEKNKSEVESLVGVIGNLGVTSGYQKTANAAKKAMYFWQGATTLSLIGLIVVAVLTAFPGVIGKPSAMSSNQQQVASKVSSIEKQNDATKVSQISGSGDNSSDSAFYHGLATRIFLSLTFGIFAAYAGRQASHFMNIERRNRKLALELEALGPFIEPLGQDERSRFRIQIGERSFGVPDHENEVSKGPDPTSGVDIIKSKEFQDFFLNIYKEAKAKLPGGQQS